MGSIAAKASIKSGKLERIFFTKKNGKRKIEMEERRNIMGDLFSRDRRNPQDGERWSYFYRGSSYVELTTLRAW